VQEVAATFAVESGTGAGCPDLAALAGHVRKTVAKRRTYRSIGPSPLA
jgi:hypothetical protein